jgi:hypothetical protein
MTLIPGATISNLQVFYKSVELGSSRLLEDTIAFAAATASPVLRAVCSCPPPSPAAVLAAADAPPDDVEPVMQHPLETAIGQRTPVLAAPSTLDC